MRVMERERTKIDLKFLACIIKWVRVLFLYNREHRQMTRYGTKSMSLTLDILSCSSFEIPNR